jgi:1,4-alpha-glucan branching enzyme
MIKTRKTKTAAPKLQVTKTETLTAVPGGLASQPATSAPLRAVTTTAAHISLELVKPGAKQVCVAGSFNGWKPEQTPLAQIGTGRWVGDLAVNPGRYEYLFVVDGQWLPDPNAKESVQNPFGGRNSVLTVSA